MSNALLASYAINAIWQVAILGAAGWILVKALHRTDPALQHRVWVAVLIFATVIPITPVIRPYLMRDAAAVEGSPISASWISTTHSVPGSSGVVLPPLAIDLIAGFYAIALLFFAVRLCWRIRCTVALARTANPMPLEAECDDLWRGTKEMFGVPGAALLSSPDVSGPVTAGFLSPVLLLPSTFFGNHSRAEFLAAAGHECAHMKRHDFWKNLFYEIAGLFSAFHPVTWFIKSQIAQTREMICDRMAADRTLCRESYALSLLQLASKVPASVPVVSHAMGIFETKTLEKRIMMLQSTKPGAARSRRYLTAVAAILLLSASFGLTGWLTQPVVAQTSTQKQAAGPDLSCTYYENGKGSEGTCGFDKEDKTKYRCYFNQDPARSNPQIACEWKVLRAQAAKKKK